MKPMFFLALLFASLNVMSQNDSVIVKMYLNLKECKDVKIYYGDRLLFESGDFTSEDTLLSFSAAVDKGQMPIEIFKKGLFGYRNVELVIYYVPDKEYLVLYRNYRVKKRYFFDAKWVNFLPYKVDNLK
jgi:hypothetical protein